MHILLDNFCMDEKLSEMIIIIIRKRLVTRTVPVNNSLLTGTIFCSKKGERGSDGEGRGRDGV